MIYFKRELLQGRPLVLGDLVIVAAVRPVLVDQMDIGTAGLAAARVGLATETDNITITRVAVRTPERKPLVERTTTPLDCRGGLLRTGGIGRGVGQRIHLRGTWQFDVFMGF